MHRLRFAFFFVVLLLAACGKESAVSQTATPTPAPTAAPSPSAAAGEGELKTVASGLQYQDLVVGTGLKPGFNQPVRIAYIGKLQSGAVFDKGSDAFKLGVGEVIKGWDQGIAGGGGVEPMREGGRRKLIIPPQLGYGNNIMGTIPANSTLIFEVQVLRVERTSFGR
ncbi:MAG: FKBP-type peptidyl-prolyl cis-trans isomerase [Blastocatellia bacterium]|nr:FKBP-type peptidyl-prolyl cis-trans isomerase [Blastocatellia bacterium]